ncbi:MAG: pyridoxamine 5'-phosphate oxidase family protein, partial [Rhodocyclaceae bacterium]|nr:pyridoxamine 5'-phosphate oxidase family protein [Rhodocyclaceae bacterium]
MPSRLEVLIDLLHAQGDAALATHAAAMPGYPLATAMSFATDEHHRPVLLISRLAEHTRNLAADPRASFLVARVQEHGEIARVSLVGEVLPIEPDALLVDRYLRFHPEAERFLQLGDFRFHRFEPQRVLVVSGFGKAGWLDGQRLLDAPHVALEPEAQLLDEARAAMPDGATLLGVDAYGADVAAAGVRR